MKPKKRYFKNDGDLIKLDMSYMEAYIPVYLFEKGLNTFNGDIVNVIGLFNFKVFDNIDKTDNAQLETFNFPSLMSFKPSVIETKEFELIPGTGEEKYYIFKFNKDDLVFTTKFVIQSIDNVENFMKLLNSGKIPCTVQYSQVIKAILKNLAINKINLNVSSALLETVVSEIYRYKNNLAIPFRKVIGENPKESELNYKAANMRTISAFNGTFNALTFEDLDSMLVTSVNKKRYSRVENHSPIEKIIRV